MADDEKWVAEPEVATKAVRKPKAAVQEDEAEFELLFGENGILTDDLAEIKEILSKYEGHSFQEELCERMKSLSLGAKDLASRLSLSATAVEKWCKGHSFPSGRERCKEVGLALEMDSDSMNAFLLKNSYPKLSLKNPFDCAALVAMKNESKSEWVAKYRKLLDEVKLPKTKIGKQKDRFNLRIEMFDAETIYSTQEFRAWLMDNYPYFSAFGRELFPDEKLAYFITLYLGDANIHELIVSGKMPRPIRYVLYPVFNGSPIIMRGLREKLIVFGLYNNMNQDEIDLLLECARCNILSAYTSNTDVAVANALGMAHSRYPHYEAECVQKVLRNIRRTEYKSKIYPHFLEQVKQFFNEKKENAKCMVAYYEGHATEKDREFEKRFTAEADKGVFHYVETILKQLCKEGLLGAEAERLLHIMSMRHDFAD